MHAVFRSLLKIFEYASINGLHNIRVYARASLLNAYTNENRGGHIYTVTGMYFGAHPCLCICTSALCGLSAIAKFLVLALTKLQEKILW